MRKIRAFMSSTVFAKVTVAVFFAAILGVLPAATPAAEKAAAPAQGVEKKNVALDEGISTEESILDDALDLVEAAQEYWTKGDEERAIGALDQAYASILEVKDGVDPKLMQSKEDLRFTISKRLMEIYASRHIAAKGKGLTMEDIVFSSCMRGMPVAN